MDKRYVDIDDVLDLFGIEDRDIYAKGTIEDALYDGTLKVYELPSTEQQKTQSTECEYWDDESNFCTLYRPAGYLGQWEDIEHAPDGLMYMTCSVCGKRQTVEFASYCGNCGARMVEK